MAIFPKFSDIVDMLVGSDIVQMLVGSVKGQELRIQYCFSFTTIFCILQHVIGAKRSNCRISVVAAQIVYGLPPVAITFTLGMMHTASTIHVLYPVGACALLYAHGRVGAMTVCNIGDNDNSVSYLLTTLPLLFWTLWLAAVALCNATLLQAGILSLTVPVFAAFAVSNVIDTLDAFYLASNSKGLPAFVAPVVEHMTRNRGGYLLWSHPDGNPDDIVTMDDVRGSVRRNGFLRNLVGAEPLQDMCLSYALFMLTLRRFAGFPMDERSESMRRFGREGLLEDPKRVFRVIEVELRFLFDFFYTKSRAYNSYSRRHVVGLLAFAMAGLVSHYGIPILDHSSPDKARLTLGVISLFTLFWIKNIIADSFSDRDMVLYVCKSVWEARTNEGEGPRLKEGIARTWADKRRLSWIAKCFGNEPWQRKLGQYSFLESYAKVPKLSGKLFSPLSLVTNLGRVGQDGDYTVVLSDHVKRAIVKLLNRLMEDQEERLSRGINSLKRNNLWRTLRHAREYMENRDTSDAQVILFWHIATSFCELESPPNSSHSDIFIVATHLSKYCAYLLTFAPELLPGHRYTTECFFDSAVKQAQHVNNEVQQADQPQLRQLFRHCVDDVAEGDEMNVVKRGALLAGELIGQVMTTDRDEGWRVLEEFWAEILLYLASSNNVDAHGEYLARGGEFITHVWALLAHVGIVQR